MKYGIVACLAAGAGLALGVGATATAQARGLTLHRVLSLLAPPDAPPDRPPHPPGGPEHDMDHAGHQLFDAYEALTLAGMCKNPSAKDTSALFDAAKEAYRTGVKAYQDKDYHRAAENAAAAHDAGRGLLSYLSAEAGKQDGLPTPPVVARPGPPPPPPPGEGPRGDRPPTPPANDAPPPPRGERDNAPPPPPAKDAPPPPRGDRDAPPPPRGDQPPPPREGPEAPRDPQAAAKDLIQQVGDRLERTGDAKAGKAFLDAAHKALDQAKAAQKDGDFFKAVQLAGAADAWSHAAEHLEHADEPAPPDRPRPPNDRPGTPPRPPEDE